MERFVFCYAAAACVPTAAANPSSGNCFEWLLSVGSGRLASIGSMLPGYLNARVLCEFQLNESIRAQKRLAGEKGRLWRALLEERCSSCNSNEEKLQRAVAACHAHQKEAEAVGF